jgi:hypothetical protein
MSVLTVIKKIGEKIVSIVEYPFVHAVQIEKLIADGLKDEPKVKMAIVGLVEQIDILSPDVIADVAANGLNLASDLKTVVDVQTFFVYISGTFLPAVEQAYSDIKADIPATTPAPAAPAAVDTTAPGLHNVVPA